MLLFFYIDFSLTFISFSFSLIILSLLNVFNSAKSCNVSILSITFSKYILYNSVPISSLLNFFYFFLFIDLFKFCVLLLNEIDLYVCSENVFVIFLINKLFSL